jgi:uncharacterized protein YegJ (DUF2314 family)
MHMTQGKALLALFAIAVAVVVMMRPENGGIVGKAQTDDVTYVAEDDPAMLAAFKKGQDTLDDFLARAAAPPPNTDSFAVKVAISDGSRKEYFWISPFVLDGESFSGRINNTPRVVSTVAEGEAIRFERSDVVDWTYENTLEKKMYGNFTACALLVREGEQAAAEFKAQYGLDCDTN